MLVEVVIVTVVVATIMTSLYVVFNRVYNAYERKGQYTNIDAIYALKMLEDYLIDEKNSDKKIKLNELLKSTTSYMEIICDASDTYCNSLFEKYNTNKIYLVNNNKDILQNLKVVVANETFKEYIEYLLNIRSSDGKFTENGDSYSHLFIIETYTIDLSEGENKEESEKTKMLNKYAYLPTGNIIK